MSTIQDPNKKTSTQNYKSKDQPTVAGGMKNEPVRKSRYSQEDEDGASESSPNR